MSVKLVVRPSSDIFRAFASGDVLEGLESLEISTVHGVGDGSLTLTSNANVIVNPWGDIVLEPGNPSSSVVVSRLRAPEGQPLIITCNLEQGAFIDGGPVTIYGTVFNNSEIQTQVIHAWSVEGADTLLLKAVYEGGQSVVNVDADLFRVDSPRITIRTRDFSVTSLRGDTTDSAWTELYVGAQVGARVGFTGLGIYQFTIRVCGHKGDNGEESIALEFKGCVRRATSGVSFVGEQSKIVLVRDVVVWDADISIEQEAILIKVRGEDGKNILWTAIVEMVCG